jgi:hypothetical protein
MILETNLMSLGRLFNDFHAMMKKAHEEEATPIPVPQDRANHILDLMISLYPFVELLKSEFPNHGPTIAWLEENCKKIFKESEIQN